MTQYIEYGNNPRDGEFVIMITPQYFQWLQARDEFLGRLEAFGVDNWAGYDMAMQEGSE